MPRVHKDIPALRQRSPEKCLGDDLPRETNYRPASNEQQQKHKGEPAESEGLESDVRRRGRYKRHTGRREGQTTPLHTSQKMTWFPANLQRAAGMDTSNRKVPLLVFMLLLSQLACDAHSVSECCRQPSRSCRLYVLLCRSGGKTSLTGDAAAGILTLGKRREGEDRLQTRLHQLLHGSRNQAAGILTMGKRVGETYSDWAAQSGPTITTPLPVLG